MKTFITIKVLVYDRFKTLKLNKLFLDLFCDLEFLEPRVQQSDSHVMLTVFRLITYDIDYLPCFQTVQFSRIYLSYYITIKNNGFKSSGCNPWKSIIFEFHCVPGTDSELKIWFRWTTGSGSGPKKWVPGSDHFFCVDSRTWRTQFIAR